MKTLPAVIAVVESLRFEDTWVALPEKVPSMKPASLA